MIELDNLHYSFRSIDGYPQPYKIVLSARELGKTSRFWTLKAYRPFLKNKRPWIYLTRNSVEITEALITSIREAIVKFNDDVPAFEYKLGTFKDGIVDVKINGEIFFRIVSLSIQLRRIKLSTINNIAGVIMDEYIIDPRSQEKYIANEAFKIKEAYTTWRREYKGKGMMPVYILGNPYSLYNPLFMDFQVDTNKLLASKGGFYQGDLFVIHWALIPKELKAQLLEANPLYQFDEDYINYALEGSAINDKNIRVDAKMPQGYSLHIVIKVDNNYIGLYRNNNYEYKNDLYYCKMIDNISAKRVIYCFDFKDMLERCQLVNFEDKLKLQSFKNAMRTRSIVFENINCYYILEEVYKLI